jgi:hypothetical protein
MKWSHFLNYSIFIKKTEIMVKSHVITKSGNTYITNTSRLLKSTRDVISRYFTLTSHKMKKLSDNDLLVRKETPMGNVFNIFEVELPLDDQFFMLNPQFHSVDHDVKLFVTVTIKIRESIVE